MSRATSFKQATFKAPNYNIQITNKFQILNSNEQNWFVILNFGHCYLFDIWDLRFGILASFSDKQIIVV